MFFSSVFFQKKNRDNYACRRMCMCHLLKLLISVNGENHPEAHNTTNVIIFAGLGEGATPGGKVFNDKRMGGE